MPLPNIPDEVRRLIVDHIPSVERLEILLLLFDGRKHSWSIKEIEEQIRSSPESIQLNVSALVESRLVAAEPNPAPTFRYKAADDALDAAVTELALVYRTRRVAVIELIYADRKSGPRSFSDAFKFGKPHDR